MLGDGTALVIVSHAPTRAMLHRWCHLHVEHECSAFKAAWFVLYLQMGAAPALDFSTVCNGTLPVVTQTEADFERLYGVGYGSGGANGTRYWEQAKHAMSSLHEVAFHAIHGSPGQPGSVAAAANPPPAYLRYSKLWVFEQARRRVEGTMVLGAPLFILSPPSLRPLPPHPPGRCLAGATRTTGGRSRAPPGAGPRFAGR